MLEHLEDRLAPALLTFTPQADAYVNKSSPNSNAGTSTHLYIEPSTVESYLRFAVVGTSGSIASAKLRLYVLSGASDGPAVYTTGTSWSETGITWNNRPGRTSVALAKLGAVPSNAWIEFDVTAAVAGNSTYSFDLATIAGSSIKMSSREGVQPPQLVVTTLDVTTPPAAPSNLTADGTSTSQINLTWTDNATNATGFKVERSTDGTTFSQVALVGANVTAYADTGLAAATTYYYRVQATNAAGDSAYSDVASGVTASSVQLITDPNQVFSVPYASEPGYLTPTTDPTFQTQITRIANDPGLPLTTANDGSGTWSEDARHNYQLNEPWNADGSLIYLENKNSVGGVPNQLYLDGNTYAVQFGTPSNMPGGGGYDQRWNPDPTHANEVILAPSGGNKLYWFDVVANQVTRSWTLPMNITYIGNTKGNPSQDGRYVLLGNATHMFVLDMSSYPAVRTGPVFDFASEGLGGTISYYSISPSGNYALVHYSSPAEALRVFDVNPTTLALTVRPMPWLVPGAAGTAANGYIYGLGHADLALNPFDNNEDVVIGQEHVGYVRQNIAGVQTVNGDGIGHVVMVRLRDGAVTSLTDPGNGTTVAYEAYASHVSTRNVNRPGWAYVSYYPGSGERYAEEVIAVKMDGSGTVERLAHLHSDFEDFTGTTGPYSAAYPDYNYRSEPHAVPSQDGQRVIFASNWVYQGDGSWIQDYVIDTRCPGEATARPASASSTPAGTTSARTAARLNRLQPGIAVALTLSPGGLVAGAGAQPDGPGSLLAASGASGAAGGGADWQRPAPPAAGVQKEAGSVAASTAADRGRVASLSSLGEPWLQGILSWIAALSPFTWNVYDI